MRLAKTEEYCTFLNLKSGRCFVMSNQTILRAVEDTAHGDWKTQSVRDEFMGLKKNEEVTYVERWTNCYGEWIRVRKQNNQTCDVKAQDLEFVSQGPV